MRKELYYHKVNSKIAADMTDIREMYINISEILEQSLPESRSKSLALTHLEDSCMRAIQALALQGELVEKGVVA